MIAVDARPLALPLTGVGRYAEGVLTAALKNDIFRQAHEGVTKPGSDVHPLLTTRSLGPAVPDVIWNETALAPYLRGRSAFLALNGQVPWRRVRDCRVVAVVHDVVHRNLEAPMSPSLRLSRESAVRASLARAEVVATSSSYTSEQLQRRYGRAADLVVPPGPTLPDASPTEVAAVRGVLAARPDVEHWLLAVGPELARKNYRRLATAVSRVPGVGLILIGGRADQQVGTALDGLAQQMPLLRQGFVTQERLAAWFEVADALAYPSLAEGFGLPLQEARHRGLPVLTSNRRPMSDSAGADAVLVDPLDLEALTDGVIRVLAAGRAAPHRLPSWDTSARALIAALVAP